MDELVGVLNASNITSTTEVVVAPPSVYLHGVSQKLRGDVKVRGFSWLFWGVGQRALIVVVFSRDLLLPCDCIFANFEQVQRIVSQQIKHVVA